ncbi:potassium/proton antiporter membrane subunit, CPA2 family [Halomicrobium zhouii]|uniref:Potassium/proton antiporter membrane subunit, CPA2 family n=1 Tax=Halomicrobium zhouii TaxID=767519 RepID=A0A1I6K4D2_9EURY|nr:cation:proton antiporter [Halomicrobium zhouii]SFR86115.1 potassium/proton antiporter membrane subunit, CPA2 family [Halomicrobium zhouii]
MAASLVEIGIALAAVALAGLAANRVGLSVIPAYIVAGILVGPEWPTEVLGVSLQLVAYGEFVEVAAELGIVFLLFFLGLEFSVGQLLADRKRITTAGSVDFLLNFGAGVGLGVLFGRTPLETLLIAGVVYISSSAVVTKSIIDRGWVANPEAEPILGTLVFEDIVIAVYLALVAALLTGAGDLTGAATDVVRAFAFLGAVAAVAWYGTDYVERAFDLPNDELFLLHVLGATTLVAGAALATGVSEAVAAFFVGTAFSQTPHTERIEDVVAPVRDLFAAVFFFAIGLTTDVTVLAGVAALLAVAVVLTTGTKLVSGTIGGRVYDLSPTRSLRTGIGLVPRAEFSLVIATLAAGAGGSLADVVPAFTVGYVLAMSVLGTVMIQHADRLTDSLAPLVGDVTGE